MKCIQSKCYKIAYRLLIIRYSFLWSYELKMILMH